VRSFFLVLLRSFLVVDSPKDLSLKLVHLFVDILQLGLEVFLNELLVYFQSV